MAGGGANGDTVFIFDRQVTTTPYADTFVEYEHCVPVH